MLIQVTEQHIADGLCCNTARCPIALALIEAGFKEVQVFRHNIYIGSHKFPVDLPCTQPFKQVQPFEFEIKLPLTLRIRRYFNDR